MGWARRDVPAADTSFSPRHLRPWLTGHGAPRPPFPSGMGQPCYLGQFGFHPQPLFQELLSLQTQARVRRVHA